MSMSYLLPIPTIQHALSETGEPTDDRVDRNADKLIDELEWYAAAIKNHKEAVGRPQS